MSGHPYQGFESHPYWVTLERAVEELVGNGDLEEKTDRKYIVGYLLQKLEDAGLLRDDR